MILLRRVQTGRVVPPKKLLSFSLILAAVSVLLLADHIQFAHFLEWVFDSAFLFARKHILDRFAGFSVCAGGFLGGFFGSRADAHFHCLRVFGFSHSLFLLFAENNIASFARNIVALLRLMKRVVQLGIHEKTFVFLSLMLQEN